MSEEKTFIGKQKVIGSEIKEDGKVEFTLENNGKQIVTQEQYESMVEPEEYDDKFIMKKKWEPAVTQILEILLKNDLTINLEKDIVIQELEAALQESYRQSIAKLFGVDSVYHVTMEMLDKVLKK